MRPEQAKVFYKLEGPWEPNGGRVLLRLPKSLHRQAARAALRDATSVNTFLVAATAKELGRRETAR